jgi:hypothetical protein
MAETLHNQLIKWLVRRYSMRRGYKRHYDLVIAVDDWMILMERRYSALLFSDSEMVGSCSSLISFSRDVAEHQYVIAIRKYPGG